MVKGSADDFDFFIGRWNVVNEQLRQRFVGSDEWDVFPATSDCRKVLGGAAHIDEIRDYLEKDTASSSPRAINRILTIRKNSRGEESVTFNIVMQKEFKPQEMLLKKISGIYRMSDNSLMEFFKKGDLLFLKWNGQFREGLSYRGNNEFTGSVNGRTMAKFEWESNNQVSVRVNFYRQAYDKDIALEGKKAFKY